MALPNTHTRQPLSSLYKGGGSVRVFIPSIGFCKDFGYAIG